MSLTGFERALGALPGERVEPPPPEVRLDVLGEYFDLVLTEMLVWHRRFQDRLGRVPLLEPRAARARPSSGR